MNLNSKKLHKGFILAMTRQSNISTDGSYSIMYHCHDFFLSNSINIFSFSEWSVSGTKIVKKKLTTNNKKTKLNINNFFELKYVKKTQKRWSFR